MNVDNWVNHYGLEHQLIPTHPEQTVSRVGDYPAEDGTVFQFGSFNNNGHVESIDDWEIMNTIGDGSCLVHAFLLLLSMYYRTLSLDDKKRVAHAFRHHIADTMDGLTAAETTLLHAVDAWLNDGIAEKVAHWLGYGLITVSLLQTQFDSPEPQLMSTDDNLPYLIIANSGGVIQDGLMGSGRHYSAVRRFGLYTSPDTIRMGIEDKKAELIDTTMARLIDMPNGPLHPPAARMALDRCDSPRKRRLFHNSISVKEAKRRAVDFGVAKSSDDKQKLCQKLHALNNVNWYHYNIYQRQVSGKKCKSKQLKKCKSKKLKKCKSKKLKKCKSKKLT